jgi:hypothetical protein
LCHFCATFFDEALGNIGKATPLSGPLLAPAYLAFFQLLEKIVSQKKLTELTEFPFFPLNSLIFQADPLITTLFGKEKTQSFLIPLFAQRRHHDPLN